MEKYDHAARDFSEVIRVQPRNGDVYIYRGIARVYQGREKEADLDFQKAFQLNPSLKKKLEPLIQEAKDKAKPKAKE